MLMFGLLLSGVAVINHYGEPVSIELILLVIASMILGRIDKRLTCLAYVIAIIYLIDTGLVLLKLKENYFTLPYEKLIVLVGVLHMIEGAMAYFYGAKDNLCVINYKGNQIAGGYRAYRKWYIPLFLFTINGYYVPLLCVLVYGDETYTMVPELKSRKSGKYILIYGCLILMVGIAVVLHQVSLPIGIMLMPIAHELLFAMNHFLEQAPYIYAVPIKGVRVIEVMKEQVQRTKIERGDIILKINGENVEDEETYYKQLGEQRLVMILEDLKGNKKILHFEHREYEELGVIVLPNE